MGALTSLTKWIPEDDLLLKNAVEAGASLESLAKGAVRFSRRFTICELQDRWRSLLYDLDTSAEASARIVEIEIELAASNPPKANRTCNSKGKESSSGRRKGDSVRSHYYAMRKRIRSEPCSADLGFLVPSTLHAGTGSDSASGDQLKPQNEDPVDNFALGAPISNDYGHQETCYDGHVGSVEDELPDGIAGGDCLYGYTENISSERVDEAGCNNGHQSFEHDYVHKDFPHILGENLNSLETSSDVREIRPPNALGTSIPYENGDIGGKPLSSFDSTNDNCESLCSDFVGNNNLSSQVPDCSDSFHQLGYSSPPSGMPIWRTIEDISTPTMAMDGHYGDKDQGVLAMDDNKKIDAPGCDGATSERKLDDGMCGGGLNNPTIISESDFMDFSDTYMDFADDEELLFIDVDEKDIADRSCLNGLSSILLSSPSDTHQDGIANSSDPRATEVLETCLGIPDAACSGESNVLCDQKHSGLDHDHSASVSGVNMPSTSHTAEPLQEFMICLLNTEDPEIPCNDHVAFPAQAFPPFSSSNLEQSSRENTGLVSSAKVLSTDGRATAGELSKVKEEQVALAQPSISYLKGGSLILLHTSDGCVVEAESSESGSRHAGICVDDPNSCTSATVALNSAPVAALKEESTALGFEKHGGPDTSIEYFLENQFQGSDHAKLYPLKIADSCKEEANMQVAYQTCLPSHTDLVSAEMGFSDSVAIMSTSDQEEQFSDSENDVPNFSDIEAMILDMDLGPYDQESCLINKEVSRYQRVDTKNAIVRLEQGARSYMNRAISSHGAFAVFYGRRLKYFIKDPEVSLGRETEDVKVDVNLAREGRANKISRRQAIIKMDEDGLFFLKNTGKFSIFVNGKEVPAKKRINLLSGSLVEIKDLRFIFEVNESAVRRYIKSLRGSSQGHNTRFDWKPDQNP